MDQPLQDSTQALGILILPEFEPSLVPIHPVSVLPELTATQFRARWRERALE